MRAFATTDDWQWFSATGRNFRARPANDIEWSEFDPDCLRGRMHLTTVLRRRDGVGVVIPCETAADIRNEPDGSLVRFDGMVSMFGTPIDLDALKTALEASDVLA